MQKQVNRIVLARPAVEAGEKLDSAATCRKVDPYLRPLYDALFDLIDYERVTGCWKSEWKLRPRFHARMHARRICDPRRGTEHDQRADEDVFDAYRLCSKAVITGDVTQVDLPTGKRSGLAEAERVLANLEGIEFIYFNEKDVVRHKLVQMIIRAYEEHSKKSNI